MIMLFLGAGASKPLGIPTMEGFTDAIIQEYKDPNAKMGPLIRAIQSQIARMGLKADIEGVLTVLQAKAKPEKSWEDVAALMTFFPDDFKDIDEHALAWVVIFEIQKIIYKKCMQIDHERAIRLFGKLWDALTTNVLLPSPGGGGYQGMYPQYLVSKIFTTNYDLSVETFLRRKKIAFDDGFHEDEVGDNTFNGNWTRGISLYKLHGSVNYYLKDMKIVRSNEPLETTTIYGEKVEGPRMIYPTGEKYATRSPFYEYLGQLRQTLLNERVCIVIGYSFRDIAINNAFLDGMSRNPNLRIILVGPSADRVRSTLDPVIQRHVLGLHGEFGDDLLPTSVMGQVKDWIPSE